MASLIELCERGWIPDVLTKFGMRKAIRKRLTRELRGGEQAQQQRFDALIEELKASPVALSVEQANEQHYEVPAEFFTRILGPRLKYSSCLFQNNDTTLDKAETAMLELTCARAELKDGERILELGCGWGSLTLWMAEHYPAAQIVAVSNSSSQRAFILGQAKARGLSNVQVITADMNNFDTQDRFDRVVSVEMFEHMRNYQELLARIGRWLKPRGTLFVHIFCHDKVMYPFEVIGEEDWMARYFFTNGLMPARHTLEQFQEDLLLEKNWVVSGIHYSRTLYAWLDRQDAARHEILPVLADVYGQEQAKIWFQRWRMFLMACGEFFAINNGNEWYVSHYLMRKP